MTVFLFPSHGEDFRQEKGDKCDKYEEGYFSFCIEKYCSYPEECCKKIDNISYICTGKSEFHKPIMEMMCLISFEGILAFYDTDTDDVNKIDKIYSEHRYSGGYFSSCDDRKSRDKKSKHDCARITHQSKTLDIKTCEEEGCWYDDREKYKEKLTIFFRSYTCIDDGKFHSKATEYKK